MIRKRVISPIPPDSPLADEDWLDVERMAQVEVTSERGRAPHRVGATAR